MIRREPGGGTLRCLELSNRNGLRAKVASLGARLVEIWIPDQNGRLGDVVLGFDDIEEYRLRPEAYFGATIGRVANRVSNGRFTLDGTTFNLARNDPPNHLHGGPDRSFDRVIWQVDTPAIAGGPVTFRLVSPNGEEGYPGTLTASVTYSLTTNNELRIDYAAETDGPTPVSLTNHSYWDLSASSDENILDHETWIAAGCWTPIGPGLIPTGEIAPVGKTPLDFRIPHRIGDAIAELVDSPAHGYDHNLILDRAGAGTSPVARICHRASGRTMEVLTTEPALQFYSGNMLAGAPGKGGRRYLEHAGLCLEPQGFPDAVNQPAFPSVILRPGGRYQQTTIYRFSTRR
jgi:aldose 1-epimerase